MTDLPPHLVINNDHPADRERERPGKELLTLWFKLFAVLWGLWYLVLCWIDCWISFLSHCRNWRERVWKIVRFVNLSFLLSLLFSRLSVSSSDETNFSYGNKSLLVKRQALIKKICITKCRLFSSSLINFIYSLHPTSLEVDDYLENNTTANHLRLPLEQNKKRGVILLDHQQ